MRSVLLATLIFVVASGSQAHAALELENGGLWSINTQVRVVACAQGRCQGDREQQTDEFFLPAGTLVEIYVQLAPCAPITAEDYCDLVPRRRRKFKLVQCDKPTLQSLLEPCSPYPRFKLRRVAGFERPASDGNSFTWKAVLKFTVRVSGYTVSVRVTAKVDGALLDSQALGSSVPSAMLELTPTTADLVERVIDELVQR